MRYRPWLLLLALGMVAVGCTPRSRPPAAQAAPSTPPPGPPPLVIPQPKSIHVDAGGWEVRGPVPWAVIQASSDDRLPAALRSLTREHPGLRLGAGGSRVRSGSWTTLRLGSPRGWFAAKPRGKLPAWARNPDGYRLQVDAGGAEIAAPTPRGAYYGIQTLAQVLTSSSGGTRCPTVTVEDWPSLGFRGAHWFVSASGVPFHRKLIERVMGRFKLNHAVIQCESARWDSHPEVAAPNSIPKKELRGLVALTRRNFIEPVPLINGPGHAGWIFRNGQNLELAEDPVAAYAFCVSHPGSDRFMKQVYAEALDVFRPRYFHLGLDEVTMRGQFPHPDCPRCHDKSVTELTRPYARRMEAWLRARGVRPVMWGDMLLSPEEGTGDAQAPDAVEAQLRRSSLPRSVLIADWHYGTGPFRSLELFRDARLETVACTWYGPRNIYEFARAAHAARVKGLLQTTWAGHFPDEKVLGGVERRQFTAFVLAAEYAWSGRTETPDRLPYQFDQVFERAYSGSSSPGAMR